MAVVSDEPETTDGRGGPIPTLDPEAHIVVVDDDSETQQLVVKFLRQNGYRVTGAPTYRELQETLERSTVDLIILDIMLPGRSGLDICRDVRSKSTVPIIMVTAKGEEADRVVGLEIGADDYLAKPISPRELLARIRAVLRRAATAPQQALPKSTSVVGFAGWRLDTRRRELTSPDGVIIDLSGAEFELLLAFVEHPQRVLSRDQLLDLARNRTASALDRSIDVHVSRLRRKMSHHRDAGALIKTVRGAGYVFVPSVARLT
ncbi:MAG: response regulator transcription factor [Alphaproteobacteria bacterium]|nr:response regulator transcription factor [Alphaproteobacteria bacterium]